MAGTPENMRSWMRKIWARLCTAILRGVVVASKDVEGVIQVEVNWLADRSSLDIEYMQPQGVFFRPKAAAEGLLLAPAGSRSCAVLINATERGTSPGGDGIAEGEGGLFYAGEFKVFLDSAGVVHLGAKTGSDYVALASQIDAVISQFETLFRGVPLANPGGGAQIQAAWVAAFPSPPTSVAAEKAKAL